MTNVVVISVPRRDRPKLDTKPTAAKNISSYKVSESSEEDPLFSHGLPKGIIVATPINIVNAFVKPTKDKVKDGTFGSKVVHVEESPHAGVD